MTEANSYMHTDVHVKHDLAGSLIDCTIQCSVTSSCYQVNYHTRNHTCELLPCTFQKMKEDRPGWRTVTPNGELYIVIETQISHENVELR